MLTRSKLMFRKSCGIADQDTCLRSTSEGSGTGPTSWDPAICRKGWEHCLWGASKGQLHGSEERLVLTLEWICLFYKNICRYAFVLPWVHSRICRRMGCIFASSVIFQQFVLWTNYYAKKTRTKPKEPKQTPPPSKFASILDHCSFAYTLKRSILYNLSVIKLQFFSCYIVFLPYLCFKVYIINLDQSQDKFLFFLPSSVSFGFAQDLNCLLSDRLLLTKKILFQFKGWKIGESF